MKIESIFEVTNFKANTLETVSAKGFGQEAIKAVRTMYPRYSKFVLTGFEADGRFIPLKLQ